jgi:hypothetical protein
MFDLKSILVSSGWEQKDDSHFEIELRDVRFFYDEMDNKVTLKQKERFQHSKMWRAEKVVMSGDVFDVGDSLVKSGLLNEIEYRRNKREYKQVELHRQQEEKLQKRKTDINKLKNLFFVGLNYSGSLGKRALFVGSVVSGSYFGFEYIKNDINPMVLINYVKNNINDYKFEELIKVENKQKLTLKQIRNIDYAIENNQVEELLERIEKTPENILYINVLKENIVQDKILN